MLYPHMLEEAHQHIEDGNPELVESIDWLMLKANILGEFPSQLKKSKELFEYILTSSYILHPTAVVASFITILSSISARKVFTETSCSTSLYTVAIAPTGSGKDIVTDIPRLFFSTVNRPCSVLVQSKIFSEGALDDIFKEHDIVVQIIDEFGDQLGQMLGSGNGHLKALMQKYKMLYSSTNSWYESANYSSSGGMKKLKPFKKEKPAFILTGITTKAQLLGHLKEKMLHDGFLNRFIIMDGSKMEPWTNGMIPNKNMPHNIIEHLHSFITQILVFGRVNSNDSLPKEDTLVVSMSHKAKNYYNKNIGGAYEKGSDIYVMCQNDKTGLMQEVSVRWRENALRLATAISAYELHEEVHLETLEWCYAFIKTMSLEFLKAFMDESNQTKQEQTYDKAVLWFKAHHDTNAPWYEISILPQKSRVFKTITRQERASLIQDLIDSGIIEKSSDGKSVCYKL